MDSKYNHIVHILRTFERSLDDKHEIALSIPLCCEASPLVVVRGYGNDFILFELVGEDENTFAVVQNYSQLKFSVVSLPKKKDKSSKRIGFRTEFFPEEECPSEKQ